MLFIFFFCFFCFFFFRLKSSISITETPTNMKISLYTYFIPGVCTVWYIFVDPFTSCVTDRYQYKQYIMMETETYIFVNPFTFCVTDRYLPQQYIIMHTIKRQW